MRPISQQRSSRSAPRGSLGSAGGQISGATVKTSQQGISLVRALTAAPRECSEAQNVTSARGVSGRVSEREGLSGTSASRSNSTGGTSGPKRSNSASELHQRTGSRSISQSFEGGSICTESEHRSNEQITPLLEFSQMFQTCPNGDGIMQCIKLYGFEKPLKLQQYVIPTLLQAFGDKLPAQHDQRKSCMTIHGPSKGGKTSSLSLALLSSIDPSVKHPQAIVITSSCDGSFEKYFDVFTLMHPVTYASFRAQEDLMDGGPSSPKEKDGGPSSPKVQTERANGDKISSNSIKQAAKAQVLVGHPSKLLTVLSSASSLCLDYVRCIIVDDADQLITGHTEKEQKQMIQDIIQICQSLECRQYSGNRIETAGASGMVPKLSYTLIAGQTTDDACRKGLRLLRTSLMKKKNLVSQITAAPPTKVIQSAKHYCIEAPKTNWCKILTGLINTLMFPCAVVFGDEKQSEKREEFLNDMQKHGLSVTSDLKRGLGQDPGKARCLFTSSDPVMSNNQSSLPKVSCVFHFEVPNDLLSLYGLRLLPLENQHASAREGVSVLFVESKVSQKVSEIEKLFNVKFLDMPLEFITFTK